MITAIYTVIQQQKQQQEENNDNAFYLEHNKVNTQTAFGGWKKIDYFRIRPHKYVKQAGVGPTLTTRSTYM